MTQSKKSILNKLYIVCVVMLATILLLSLVYNIIEAKKYQKIIDKWACNYELDRNLVFAIVKTESDFDVNAESSKGAKGLMQLKQSTFDFVAEKYKIQGQLNVFDADDNIRVGCCYLRYLIDKFSDETVVLCAYNAGEGNVQKWLNNSEYSADGKTLIEIPFKETSQYVKKVLTYKIFYGGA